LHNQSLFLNNLKTNQRLSQGQNRAKKAARFCRLRRTLAQQSQTSADNNCDNIENALMKVKNITKTSSNHFNK
jgi:hypothetical protein